MSSAKTKGQAKKSAAAEDEGMDPTQYYENRLKALASQKEAGNNPYPHKFDAKLSIPEYVKKYESLNGGDHLDDVEESIAGRLMNKRSSSSKLFFYDLHGGGAKVQVMADARKSELDEEEFTRFHSSVKRGDIVGIIGFPGKSKRGELSIFPKTFIVLSHCLHMMPRQKIGPGSEAKEIKLPEIKKTIRRAVSLVGFIYNHTSTLSLLRRFTNKRELVRPAATRFATSFLSLQRIYQEKVNVRKMFTSEEWDINKLSKEAKGREATKTVLMPSFWRSVVFTLKVMAPLVRVLRLVDGDMKPAMGYIYEAMDKAKETIEKSFDREESKYRDIFSIIDNRWDCQLHRPLHAAAHFLNPEIYYDNCRRIDYDLEIMRGLYDCIDRLVIGTELRNKVTSELEIYKTKKDLFGRELAELQRKSVAPAQWWKMFGHSAPNLQRFAIRILGLTCSASGCERNWSVFEQIHSKKRNRLEHQKLNDLVYVKYNQKLRERHEKRSELDPISLDDIDDCNEWLVGEMDDDDGEGGDLVFDDDTLDWDTVFDATGAGEPSTFTRSNTKKRKEPTTSDPRGKKSKSLVDEDDENEEENHDEPSQAEEEEEGYASLDDDGVHGDDYAEVDLDD